MGTEKRVQLTSGPETPPTPPYAGATICAGVFYQSLMKREVVPSAPEHHVQEGLTQLPSAQQGHVARKGTGTEAPAVDVLNWPGDGPWG